MRDVASHELSLLVAHKQRNQHVLGCKGRPVVHQMVHEKLLQTDIVGFHRHRISHALPILVLLVVEDRG